MIRTIQQQSRVNILGAGSIGPGSLQLFLVPLLVWCLGDLMVIFAWLAGVEDKSVASLIAIGFVCLTASLLGQAPAAVVGRGETDKLPSAMMASIIFRAGATVLGMVTLVKLGLLSGPVGAAGCGLWYASMLTVDVWVASRHIAMNFPASNNLPERA